VFNPNQIENLNSERLQSDWEKKKLMGRNLIKTARFLLLSLRVVRKSRKFFGLAWASLFHFECVFFNTFVDKMSTFAQADVDSDNGNLHSTFYLLSLVYFILFSVNLHVSLIQS